MRAGFSYLVILIALMLLCAACDKGGDGGGGSGSGGGPGGAIVGNVASSSELNFASQVLALVNQERANNGSLPPLSNNAAMAQVAYDHSWDMRYRSFFAHTNLRGALADFAYTSDRPARLHPMLAYADMTTSPDGDPVTIPERLAEIYRRYPVGHVAHRAIAQSEPELMRLEQSLKRE